MLGLLGPACFTKRSFVLWYEEQCPSRVRTAVQRTTLFYVPAVAGAAAAPVLLGFAAVGTEAHVLV